MSTEKMKKALIITNLSGFLFKFELDNVKLLQSMGYEVHFASNMKEKGYPYEAGHLKESGIIFHDVEIARSPYMWKMNYRALKEIKRIVADENIGIIHCHTPVGALLGRLSAVRKRNKDYPKIVYTAHGFHFYKGAPLFNNIVFKTAEHFLAHFTDVLITINSEDFAQAKNMHLRSGGYIVMIPGVGLDLSRFHPVSDSRKEELRNRYGISNDAFFVLSAGELNHNKNHRTVIKAIKYIKDEMPEDNTVYGICGDGYWKEDIQNFVRKSGLEKDVIFFGYQLNIEDFYAMADITAFPSVREGLGMAALESLAMGIPVAASDNQGTREYMKDGDNGFVCRWDDPQSFKEAIIKYKRFTCEQKQEMRSRCRASVMKYDKKNTRRIMKKIYMKLDREVYGNGEDTENQCRDEHL